jgi:hypothetical protein
VEILPGNSNFYLTALLGSAEVEIEEDFYECARFQPQFEDSDSDDIYEEIA